MRHACTRRALATLCMCMLVALDADLYELTSRLNNYHVHSSGERNSIRFVRGILPFAAAQQPSRTILCEVLQCARSSRCIWAYNIATIFNLISQFPWVRQLATKPYDCGTVVLVSGEIHDIYPEMALVLAVAH
jgi:hypothetical protein